MTQEVIFKTEIQDEQLEGISHFLSPFLETLKRHECEINDVHVIVRSGLKGKPYQFTILILVGIPNVNSQFDAEEYVKQIELDLHYNADIPNEHEYC